MKQICINRLLQETKNPEEDEEPFTLRKIDIDALLDYGQVRPLEEKGSPQQEKSHAHKMNVKFPPDRSY